MRRLTGAQAGSLIGALFGLIYLLINAGPLPLAAGIPVRLAGGCAFVAVLVTICRSAISGGPAEQAGGFGSGYWLVVTAEAVALAAGPWILNGPLNMPQAGVAWVSFVVGVHFFALAAVFGLRSFHYLGAVITACGIAGLALAALGVGEAPITVISGLIPGAVLLAFGYWGALWHTHHQNPNQLTEPAATAPPASRQKPAQVRQRRALADNRSSCTRADHSTST
jgi:hypothetical protein